MQVVLHAHANVSTYKCTLSTCVASIERQGNWKEVQAHLLQCTYCPMFAERVLQLLRKGECQRACVTPNRQKRQRAEEVVRSGGFDEEQDMDDEEWGEEEWAIEDVVVQTSTTSLAALHRQVGDGGEVDGGEVRDGEVDGGEGTGGETGSGDVGAEETETPGTVEPARHVAHVKSHNGSRFPKPTPVSLELSCLHSCIVLLLTYPSAQEEQAIDREFATACEAYAELGWRCDIRRPNGYLPIRVPLKTAVAKFKLMTTWKVLVVKSPGLWPTTSLARHKLFARSLHFFRAHLFSRAFSLCPSPSLLSPPVIAPRPPFDTPPVYSLPPSLCAIPVSLRSGGGFRSGADDNSPCSW